MIAKTLHLKSQSHVRPNAWTELLLVISQKTPGLHPRLSFKRFLFGDLTEGEGNRAVWGVLLPGHNAVLDSFFDHLQETNIKVKMRRKWKNIFKFHHILSFLPSLAYLIVYVTKYWYKISSFMKAQTNHFQLLIEWQLLMDQSLTSKKVKLWFIWHSADMVNQCVGELKLTCVIIALSKIVG